MNRTARFYEYVVCPDCRRTIGAYYPPDAARDGAIKVLPHIVKPVKGYDVRGTPCPGSGAFLVRDRVTGTGWKRPE